MMQASSGEPETLRITEIVDESVADEATAAAVGALVDLFTVMRRSRPQHGASAHGLLFHLAKCGTLRGRDLSTDLHLDQSTVSRHLAALEADGLVERAADPSDGRAFVVKASPAGMALARKAMAERVGQFAGLIADWPAADRAEFARLAGRLASDLDASTGVTSTGVTSTTHPHTDTHSKDATS